MQPSLLKPQSARAPKIFLDTLSDILEKVFTVLFNEDRVCLRNPSQATLGFLLSSVVYIFLLKMLSLVLIKNCNL